MKNKILIVDDVAINREILTLILEDLYEIVEAEDGEQAIDILKESNKEIAAILLDLMMPKVDGYGVIQYLEESKLLERIPVIIISGESGVEAERNCLKMGASDFIRKPFDNIIVRKRVQNNVELFMHKNRLEEKVAEQTEELLNQAEQLKKYNEKIIEILGTVIEYRNLESGEHIKRVKGFTKILAEQMAKDYPEYDLTPEKIEIIVAASALHDVGKIAIKDAVLLKPGKLDKDEFEYMKSHTTRGCDIINQMNDAWDETYAKASYEICRYHHERYDGKGYPDGLSGEDIPISAQLVSVADVYDALVSERVYKSAYTKDKAYHMILMGECGVFSPKLMECLKKTKTKMEKLADKNQKMELNLQD